MPARKILYSTLLGNCYGWLRERLADAGLTRRAILTMMKSALPSTILLAAYQSQTWSEHFNVLDYLVAIEGLLAFCILPRARFLQTLVLNVTMVSLATAVNLLALWSAMQARKHTSELGESGYNSSCSAVCAIWFAVQIYLINALRSSRPQFQFPCINYSIFTIIALVQAGPSFKTSREAVDFLWLELQAFLTGFAVAAGVSLIILPHTNRDIAIEGIRSYIGVMKEVVTSFEPLIDDFTECEAATNLTAKLAALQAAHAKLGLELEFATRDFGFNYLTALDLTRLYQYLRQIYLPLLSLGILADLGKHSTDIEHRSRQTLECKDSSESFRLISHEAVAGMKSSLDFIAESFINPTKATKGEVSEVQTLNDRIVESCEQQAARMTAIMCSASSYLDYNNASPTCNLYQCRLCLLRFVITRHTLAHACAAMRPMLGYVKGRIECGDWNSRKLIYPVKSTLFCWLKSAFGDSASTGSPTLNYGFLDCPHHETINTLLLGRNPQHLPPTNLLGQVGDLLRAIPRSLRSQHSYFGFRAMCASMSIAIIAYLRPSAHFFKEQRCLWAVIMTGIALNNSVGQSAFSFMLRVTASIMGTLASLVAWYAADGRASGVIVLAFLHVAGSFYWCVVKPKYTLVAIVSAVTPIISLGYAINIDVLPQQVLYATDTPVYPLYRIALYRLVNVIIGLAVAYFWSILPFPVTETFVMRQEIGSCAFLLAKYNAITTETIMADLPDQTASRLQDARLHVLLQAQHHVSKLKLSSSYSAWQPNIGGKVPVLDYRETIEILEELLTSMVIMSYASSKSKSPKLRDLADVAREVTNTLCVIAAAITSGNALPPVLASARVQQWEKDAPETNKTADAALTVAEAATDKLRTRTIRLRQIMRRLCGELDLSLATLSAAASPATESAIPCTISAF